MITLLAVLQFIPGAICLLGAVFSVGAGLFSNAAEPAPFVIVGVLIGALGGLQVYCGFGLWNLKTYGRTIQLVLAWIGLLGFPIGTVISILIIVYLRKPGIRILFSERPPNDLTQEETMQVAAAAQSSGAVAIVAVVVTIVVGVAVLGIVAAIAIPGLLRARMAGNEAAAIGSLRTINTANISYLTNCANNAGYASSLVTLAIPRAGSEPSFLGSDLGLPSPFVRNGYMITYVAGDTTMNAQTCMNGVNGISRTYFVTAEPVTEGTTGMRYFATNENQTIFQATVPITAIDATGMPEPHIAMPIR